MYTAVVGGKCASSITNTKGKEMAMELIPAELDVMEDNSGSVKLLNDFQ
jgi:hypothetical protein